jgi:Fic family protein
MSRSTRWCDVSILVYKIDILGNHVDMASTFRHDAPDPGIPYDALPPLPTGELLETTAVLKASIAARDALARLRAATSRLPNPTIVINSIPLLEARDSSRIENIVTTSDQLFRHQGETAVDDPAVKEALRYRTALMQGFQSLDQHPITTRTAVTIASTLLGTPTDIRRVPGTTLRNAATGETIYTPPQGEALLRDKLADWERFVHDDSIDSLVRMAASHYQFEAIHPFLDGNGRTGRILNTLMLVERGLLDQPLLYLSRYILERRDEYYRLLRDVTFAGAWQEWLEFMLAGVRETADWTAALVERVMALMALTDEHVRASLPRIHSQELVQLLFTYPYARIGNVVDAGIAKRQTASEYLQRLAGLGVLEQITAGREKLYLNRRLLDVLGGREDWDPLG